jgi:ubiquinone/menaquinone biosynthesis C-methylase UbiE
VRLAGVLLERRHDLVRGPANLESALASNHQFLLGAHYAQDSRWRENRSSVKPVKQTSTFEDAANVAAWRRHAASRAAFLAPSTARMLRLARLAPGHRVLVVGAGTGEEALLAAERVGATGQVVATDVSAAMIAEAKRSVAASRVANVRCVVMDAQDLKFRSGAFDAVIARNSLMFIPDLSLALSEMNRVLKPGGRIAATVWAAASRNPRMLSLLDAARALGVKPPPTATFRLALRLGAPAHLEAALRKAGFAKVVVQRQPLVARFDTVDEAMGVVLDSGGARELMNLMAGDSEARMRSSLERRWRKYAVRGGVRIPGEQLVAAGAHPA